MTRPITLPITTTQTIGPFPHEAWRWAFETPEKTASSAKTVTITGTVYDGNGAPVNDALLEAWAPAGAAADGSPPSHPIPGFRRVPAGEQGEFRFEVPQPATRGEPVMFVTVFARGLLKHQFTAVFLEDDTGLAQSALLGQVPAERRATLVARKEGDGRYRWDIWLQTDRETVFFDYA